MNLYLGILLLIINVTVAFKNYRTGLVLYLILSLISPHIHVKNIIISYEIFSFLPLIVIFFFVSNNRKVNFFAITFFLYFIILFLSSLISMIWYDYTYNLMGLFGHLRFILITYIAIKELNDDTKSIDKILSTVLLANFIITIIQLTIPESVDVFYQLYYKEGITPLVTYLNEGIIRRGIGSFGMPTLLGALSLISLTFYLTQNNNRLIKMRTLKICISLITGLFSLSKTFILGSAIIIIVYMLLNILLKKKIKVINFSFILKKVLIIAVGIGSIIIVLLVAEKFNLGLMWYLEYLLKPIDALDTRYVLSSNEVLNNLKVIKDNLIIGVGHNSVNGEFTGDSLYTNLMHNTGVVGIIIIFVFFTRIGYNALIIKDNSKILMIIVIFLVGFAYPILFSIFSSIIISYSYTINRSNRKGIINAEVKNIASHY